MLEDLRRKYGKALGPYRKVPRQRNPVTDLIPLHRRKGAQENEMSQQEYAHLQGHGGCANYANFLHRSLPGSVIHSTPLHDWV